MKKALICLLLSLTLILSTVAAVSATDYFYPLIIVTGEATE